MKRNLMKFASLAWLPAAALTLTSCSTSNVERTVDVYAERGVPGGTAVETHKITAQVTAVDAASRKVTLLLRDGTRETLKAGPEVVNFNQIQVGDQVKVLMVDELVVFVRKNGEPRNDRDVGAVVLAPVGAKPGGVVANTKEVTATIQSLDLEHRTATLRFPDGHSKTFKIRKDVDMTKAKLGDEVVFRATEALAISVEKP
jgi:hypothetical protein